MTNRFLFSHDKNRVNDSEIINTRWGNELLIHLEDGPLHLSQIKERYSAIHGDLLSGLNQFLQRGLIKYQDSLIHLTLPVITGDEREMYLLTMESHHVSLCERLNTYIETPGYRESISSLQEAMDYNGEDLHSLLVACFGVLWGGMALFGELHTSHGAEKIILLEERELGLCQSMSSYTEDYTFSSFGSAEDVFRDALGNLFNQKTITHLLSSLVSPYLEEEYGRTIHLVVDDILNRIGDVLLAIKKGSILELSEENAVLIDLLKGLLYIEDNQVLIPIFFKENSELLVEIVLGFQRVLAQWYLEEAYSSFILKKKDRSIHPGICWNLQLGQISTSLIRRDMILYPVFPPYWSMVFDYPVKKAREIFLHYSWEYERRSISCP